MNKNDSITPEITPGEVWSDVEDVKMDTGDIQRLLERTRQRREMLNQKLGRTPEAAPRKRTLEENTTHNVESKTVDENSPGKRQCLREEELVMKPDTPAISSVKSRMAHLKTQRQEWSSTADGDIDANAPVSTKKPVIQTESNENNQPVDPAGRRGRFAKLAQNINNWEDDLSHPTIHSKPEEPKPRWQPPKKPEENGNKPIPLQKEVKKSGSPIKAYNPEKSMAPPPPPAPPLPASGFSSVKKSCDTPVTKTSPVKAISTHTVVLKQPPQGQQSKPQQHHIRQVIDQIPVNSKGLNESVMSDVSEEPTNKPVSQRMETWKQSATPKKNNMDPAEAPMSSKLASWEQKISNTPTKAAVSKVHMPAKQMATPVADKPPLLKPSSATKAMSGSVSVAPGTNAMATHDPDASFDPTSQPVASRMASWQQKVADAEPKREEEPTAYSILARMSAWEDMSSSNKVSYIKKIDPGASPNSSPAKPVQKAPVTVKTKMATPNKTFEVKTGPMESANRSPAKTAPVFNTPGKLQPGASPSIGSATKMMQQKLIEQTQHSKTDDAAEKLRKERMAELETLQNRWHNGVLKEDYTPSQTQVSEQRKKDQKTAPNGSTDKKEEFKARARADFESKLVAMGFELSDGCASYNFKNGNPADTQKKMSQLPPRPPPPPNQNGKMRSQSDPKPHQSPVKQQPQIPQASSAPRPTSSIYRLISQKRSDTDRPQVSSNQTLTRTDSKKKVQFRENKDDSFDSTEDEELRPRYCSASTTEDETDNKETELQSEDADTQESSENEGEHGDYNSYEETEEDLPKSYVGQPKQIPQPVFDDDSDDMTFSAFVPPSVRRQSVLPNPPSPQRQHPDDNLSLSSQDSHDDHFRPKHHVASVPADYRHRSTTNLVSLGQQQMNQESSSSLTSECSATSSQSSLNEPPRRYGRQDSETGISDDEDRDEMDNFLDEAMSDEDSIGHQGNMASKPPAPIPRKRRSHMMATSEDNPLAYSVSMYRNHGPNDKVAPSPKARIVRNREFCQDIEEEDIEMPTHLPPDVERKSIKERIQELQELVTQEQNVIMQTSNALNQCCTENSHFAGSAEQVECNRLLLLACQKRMSYMTEIQRLKDTGQLDPPGSGPKGSVTISDIRLPLKKEFVTKIGTSSDNTVHYFLILIRNNSQVIVTQMLSTHDPMMRGSLDFPNLIKIHGISSSFKLNLEIYSMSVSRESLGKEKKRKTPKKATKGHLTPLESPGGPSAVRTTSFTHITTLPLTMRSLDKSCFTLERIPYLSPLHGTIYLRVKCLMEQNVEERGFLTMFEDVSGFGAWHRRWCVLAGNKLCYWKYPDDEKRKEPMGFIDLKRCITEKVGLIPRDICARPNTFEVVSVRQPIRGEQDTLVTKTYNTMTTTKHNLSADTKEERINWCNKINRALANIRTWHSDAMRPVKVPSKQR